MTAPTEADLVARLRAVLRFCYPDHMTPYAKRLFEQILDGAVENCELCGQRPHTKAVWAFGQEAGEHKLFVCQECAEEHDLEWEEIVE